MTPKLIHPVKIYLVQLDPDSAPARDPQFGELTDSAVFRDPIIVTAQLALGQTNQFAQRPGGDDPRTDGHVALRVVDWKHEGFGRKLNKGDRITALYVGGAQESEVVPVDWIVREVRPAAHYRGGFHFWLLFYQDMKVERVE